MNLDLTWDQLKPLIDAKGLTVQWLDIGDRYMIYVVDGTLVLYCYIHKTAEETFKNEFEATYKTPGNTNLQMTNSPFASKRVGKYKLFQRVHGVSHTFSTQAEEVTDFSVPYAMCKINGVEIIGGEAGDTCNFTVHDTPAGTITTVPNYLLNQFGFDVNIAPGYYNHKSPYDADLIQNMGIKISYTNNGTIDKTVGFNIILHELKL